MTVLRDEMNAARIDFSTTIMSRNGEGTVMVANIKRGVRQGIVAHEKGSSLSPGSWLTAHGLGQPFGQPIGRNKLKNAEIVAF
ncbi:MAG: hypothetical protein RI101_04940 [Nitrospira sp.]|jgi:hypothetical protein|nr:hypothetical protein [Nitrospira sp.]